LLQEELYVRDGTSELYLRLGVQNAADSHLLFCLTVTSLCEAHVVITNMRILLTCSYIYL